MVTNILLQFIHMFNLVISYKIIMRFIVRYIIMAETISNKFYTKV